MQLIRYDTADQLGNINTKPHWGYRLQEKHLSIVGHRHYPPPQSKHYEHLQLEDFNINPHRGIFLKFDSKRELDDTPSSETTPK